MEDYIKSFAKNITHNTHCLVDDEGYLIWFDIKDAATVYNDIAELFSDMEYCVNGLEYSVNTRIYQDCRKFALDVSSLPLANLNITPDQLAYLLREEYRDVRTNEIYFQKSKNTKAETENTASTESKKIEFSLDCNHINAGTVLDDIKNDPRLHVSKSFGHVQRAMFLEKLPWAGTSTSFYTDFIFISGKLSRITLIPYTDEKAPGYPDKDYQLKEYNLCKSAMQTLYGSPSESDDTSFTYHFADGDISSALILEGPAQFTGGNLMIQFKH